MEGQEEFTTDPMELEDGHFEKDEIEQEKSFKDQFREEENFVEDPGGMLDETTTDTVIDKPKLDENGQVIVEDPKFEFDASLAEAEKAELKELNEKLGTNFEDLKDLREAINQTENKTVVDDIQEDQQFVNYFEAVLRYGDKDVVMEDKKMLIQQKGVEDLKNPEVQARLDEEVLLLEENGSLEFAARSIRSDIRNILDKKKAKINTFNENQKQTLEQQQKAFKDKVQESINTIFKAGTFLGIKPSKEDLLNAYTDVTKNKHIDHLRANPNEAVEYVLFKKYKQEIAKKLGKPDFKAGVKNTLENLGMVSSEQTSKAVVTDNKEAEQEKLSYFNQFIK